MDINMSKLQETVRTGKPGVLQPMGSQRVELDLATEQQQMGLCYLMRNCWVFLTHNPLSNSWDNQHLSSHWVQGCRNWGRSSLSRSCCWVVAWRSQHPELLTVTERGELTGPSGPAHWQTDVYINTLTASSLAKGQALKSKVPWGRRRRHLIGRLGSVQGRPRWAVPASGLTSWKHSNQVGPLMPAWPANW